jgi:hypothetical protein
MMWNGRWEDFFKLFSRERFHLKQTIGDVIELFTVSG